MELRGDSGCLDGIVTHYRGDAAGRRGGAITSIAGCAMMTRMSGKSGVIDVVSCHDWSAIFRWAGPMPPWPSVASMAIQSPLIQTSVHIWKPKNAGLGRGGST